VIAVKTSVPPWCGPVQWWLDLAVMALRTSVKLPTSGLVSTWMGDRVRVHFSGAGHLSRYVTIHPGQPSLAIPPLVGAMSTSQRRWRLVAGE